jgi:formyl-CoA transferase
MREEVTSYTSKLSKFECQDRMWELNQPCGAVYSIGEAMEGEQVKARNMLTTVYDDNIGEEIQVPGVVIRLESTPGSIDKGSPVLGQDTAAVLEAAGYTAAQIEALAAKGVICTAGDAADGKGVL